MPPLKKLGYKMFEEMKIGVSLQLKGDAPTKLKAFHQLVEKLTKTSEALEQKLRVIGNNIERMNVQLGRINPRMKEFYESTGASQKTLNALGTAAVKNNTAFTGLNTRLSSAVVEMDNLTRSAGAAKAAMDGLGESAVASKMAGAGGGGRRGGGGRHGAGGVHVHPLAFGGMGFSGPAMAVGGVALLGYGSYKKGAVYQQQLAQLVTERLPGGTMDAADKFIQANRVNGVTPAHMAEALTDAAVITRDFGHAKAIAPTIAKMRYAAEGVFGEGKFSKAQEQAAIKVAEMVTGSKDPKKLSVALDHMFRVMASTGMRVTPTDYLSVMRSARGAVSGSEQFKNEAMSNVDPDYVFYGLETMIQELGGPAIGRQLGQFQSHILHGRMTTAGAKEAQRLDLVKKGFAKYNKIGMIQRILPGGIKGSDKDMLAWTYEVFKPALEAKGEWNRRDALRSAGIMFTNTDLTAVTTAINQMDKIKSNIATNKGAMGIQEGFDFTHGLTSGKMKDLGAAWETFNISLSKLTTPAINSGIDRLISMLDSLTKLMDYFEREKTDPNNASFEDMLHGKGDLLTGKKISSPSESLAAKTAINLYVDGRQLASTLSHHFTDMLHLSNWSTQSQFNTSAGPTVAGATAPR